MRQQKVKQILAEALIPDHAEFGTVFVCRDTQRVWITARSGEVLNLTDLLEGKSANVRTPGPAGPAGRDGKNAEPHYCQAALDEVHRLRCDIALLRTEFARLQEMYRDLVARDERGSQYLEYLRLRREALAKKV